MSATAKRYVPKAQRKPYRNQLYAKLHALWSQLRPDLDKGSDEYKEALYSFAEAELKVDRIGSFTQLTDSQLGKVIDVLERERKQPRLIQESSGNVTRFVPKPQTSQSSNGQNQQSIVEHLCSLSQRFAINRLFGYLGWSDDFRARFVRERFRTEKIEMLKTKEAHALIRILLNCAGSRYWKNQGKDKVSKPMIAAAIPRVKKEIGIE